MKGQPSWRILVNPWIIIGSLLLGLILFALTIIFLWNTRLEPYPGVSGTAVMNVISAPTDTAAPPEITEAPVSTEIVENTEIMVGSVIMISGTGGDGLRLRFQAGLNSNVRLLGDEGEIFEVMDGPQTSDGYVWWYLESPKDRTRRGWAVADFLVPANIP